MVELASKGQLRLAFLRWAIVTVPFILLLGMTSARLAPSGSDNLWYTQLVKPDIMPPPWAFGVVWGGLYILLGLSLAMVLNARGASGRGVALVAFAVQMAANLAWSPLFFGYHQVLPALYLLAALLVLALITALLFARIRMVAAVLFIPYLLWIGFAGYLLFLVNDLNPDASNLVPSHSVDQIQIR